jgi:hypothetical protein
MLEKKSSKEGDETSGLAETNVKKSFYLSLNARKNKLERFSPTKYFQQSIKYPTKPSYKQSYQKISATLLATIATPTVATKLASTTTILVTTTATAVAIKATREVLLKGGSVQLTLYQLV